MRATRVSPDLQVGAQVPSWCPVCSAACRPASDCDSKVFLWRRNANNHLFSFLFILMSSLFSRAPLLCNWLRTREPCNPLQLHTAGNGGRDLFQSRRLTCNRSRLCPRGEQQTTSSPRFVRLGPTVCERVEGFAGDVQHGESRALGLRGPPAGQGGLQGGGPVADHSQGLALHWDDLTALRFGGVGVWLGH